MAKLSFGATTLVRGGRGECEHDPRPSRSGGSFAYRCSRCGRRWIPAVVNMGRGRR